MREEIINHLISVGVGLGILAISYLVWLISGVVGVATDKARTWSWKRFWSDILKLIAGALGTAGLIVGMDLIEWYSGKMGADVSGLLDGLSIKVLVAAVIAGSVFYLRKGLSNIVNFINKSGETVELTGGQDYSAVAEEIKAIVSSIYTKQDKGSGDTTDTALVIPQMGAFPYYRVDVSTPNTFYNAVIGKGFDEGFGFQCVSGFKEFMFSLSGAIVATNTGGASGYAYQQSQIEPLGFTWHAGSAGLQNGDWGVFGNGQYGHVAMYYNGKWLGQNQGASNPNVGNAFNLCSIGTGALLGYYRPNIYNKTEPVPTPEPATKTVSYTYKPGDTFGQVIVNLGLATEHGLWGPDGDVEYYGAQIRKQGIYGNIPIGTTIKLKRR